MNFAIEKQINFKSFFKRINRSKFYNHLHKSRNEKNASQFSGNGYFESIEYFCQRYFIEQRRAERKGYQFSLVVIDLNDEEQSSRPNTNDTLIKEVEEVLFTTSKMVLRTTDVVVKYCPYKLAILLPDTDQKGRQLAVQRITDTLKEILDPSLHNIFKKIKIHSYSYPLQENEITEFINDKIFKPNISTIALEKTMKHIKSYYFKNQNHNELDSFLNNFHLRISSIDTLALKNPFCFLNEIIFNFSWNWQKALKRCLDIVLSLMSVILLSPFILLISIFIKITSPGPIFFKQERIGYLGNKFIIYKFRTMYNVKDEKIHKKYIKNFITCMNQNELHSGSQNRIYKIKNDPRITPIGRFLRRTSMDEIGQFINVLKGDMSLVGPRPPIPYEVDMYDIWHKRRFLTVKPGITGLWQIYGRSETTFNDMVRLDLAYASNWSLALDLKILIKTIWAVLSMKGAY